MDYERVALVVCLTLFIIIGINAALYVTLTRRNGTIGQIELMRRAARRARHPWEEEDKSLEELSRLVAPYRTSQGGKPDSDDSRQ